MAAKRSGSRVFVNVGLLGAEELQRKLNKLALKDAKKIVRQSLRAASRPIMERVKVLAPKGKTGELEKSLKLRAIKRSRKKFGVQIIAGGNRKIGRSGEKRSSFYASFVELGTKYQKAQKFMRNAKTDGAAQFDRDMADLVGKGIEKAATKK